MKLSAVLIGYFIVTLVIATLIPNLTDTQTMQTNDVPFVATVFKTPGVMHFFTSGWFIVPLIIFFLNLLPCTIHRISTKMIRKKTMHYGPDIIQIGIMLLLASAVISLFGRIEGELVLENEAGKEYRLLPNEGISPDSHRDSGVIGKKQCTRQGVRCIKILDFQHLARLISHFTDTIAGCQQIEGFIRHSLQNDNGTLLIFFNVVSDTGKSG
ncbi:MAG: hypothetical protein JW881_06875 [Spirochaetales bacterium]|nr:hypothetical protein [Spirochaetales bacterium]